MAQLPAAELVFDNSRCPDCGHRSITLPSPLPDVGDDFDWSAREFEGYRAFMLEELAARFPERRRWTQADLEVVIIEVLAAQLDFHSDMLDRVVSEAFLETARRPQSVRRLLQFIGYDAVREAGLEDDPPAQVNARTAAQKLEAEWAKQPSKMEFARLAGPRSVHQQRRIVTIDDYRLRLEEHPLVLRAAATSRWTGSWRTIYVAVILRNNAWLDARMENLHPGLIADIEHFHQVRGIPLPPITPGSEPFHRTLLRAYLDAYRMVGQEVFLEDAQPVGIVMEWTVVVADNYFHSEVRRDIERALSNQAGGFFEPGRFRFGENIRASDLFHLLMQIDGVSNLCLKRFKRVGRQYGNRVEEGYIDLNELEIAICDNDPANLERGYYRLALSGGRKG
ncbi:hypothetical protein [Bacterioplanoides sp.]|uniref:hypothetical protein n=1 Tax=Bacterioplanoides sp. TaxID=2066072 RepID=UPI003B00D1B7